MGAQVVSRNTIKCALHNLIVYLNHHNQVSSSPRLIHETFDHVQTISNLPFYIKELRVCCQQQSGDVV